MLPSLREENESLLLAKRSKRRLALKASTESGSCAADDSTCDADAALAVATPTAVAAADEMPVMTWWTAAPVDDENEEPELL